jgi:hypothetical protein
MTIVEDNKKAKELYPRENSILEADLKRAGQQEIVSEIKVWEITDGYYVTTKIELGAKWRMEGDFYIDDSTGQTPEEWFVTTRRNRKSPRIYKDLNRLNKCLKEMCLEIDFSLIRNKGSKRPQRKPQPRRGN